MSNLSQLLTFRGPGQVVGLVNTEGTVEAFIAGSPVTPPASVAAPAIFIDPSNVTGFASDSNTGQTANNVPPGSGPILTIAEENKRFAGNPNFPAGETTVTILSDDPSGTPLDWTPLTFVNGVALHFQGTPVVLHMGGTLNAGTLAQNPTAAAGGQRQTAHTTDLASFTPFVVPGAQTGGTAAIAAYLRDTVTGNQAWIMRGVASATASLSTAVDDTGTVAGPLTIGDAYVIRRGSTLTLATSNNFLSFFVTFADFDFSVASVGGPLSLYTRCSFQAQVFETSVLNNCFLNQGFLDFPFAAALTFVTAGGWITNISDTFEGTIEVLLNPYLTGSNAASGVTIGQTGYRAIEGRFQIQDTNAGSAIGILQGADFFGDLVWGNGHAGTGVLVYPGATLALTASTNWNVFGALGQFTFIGPAGTPEINVARAWDDATGAYTESGGVATRATTWANLIATIGAGGFSGNAQCVQTNAAVTAS